MACESTPSPPCCTSDYSRQRRAVDSEHLWADARNLEAIDFLRRLNSLTQRADFPRHDHRRPRSRRRSTGVSRSRATWAASGSPTSGNMGWMQRHSGIRAGRNPVHRRWASQPRDVLDALCPSPRTSPSLPFFRTNEGRPRQKRLDCLDKMQGRRCGKMHDTLRTPTYGLHVRAPRQEAALQWAPSSVSGMNGTHDRSLDWAISARRAVACRPAAASSRNLNWHYGRGSTRLHQSDFRPRAGFPLDRLQTDNENSVVSNRPLRERPGRDFLVGGVQTFQRPCRRAGYRVGVPEGGWYAGRC